jgi:hypothetical protein
MKECHHTPSSEHRTSMLRLVPAVVRRVAVGVARRQHAAHIQARADHLPRRQTPRLDSSIRFLRRIQTRSGQKAGCALCKMGWTALLAALKEDKDMQVNVRPLASSHEESKCNTAKTVGRCAQSGVQPGAAECVQTGLQ